MHMDSIFPKNTLKAKKCFFLNGVLNMQTSYVSKYPTFILYGELHNPPDITD